MIESSPDYGHLKVMAGIGAVCIQWALLEHLTLGLIGTIENTDLDRVYLIFGSLDMKPRLDMAINLAQAEKVPVVYVKRIKAVRTALREEGLADKRNQAVHGVHKASDQPDSIQLTMPRWSGERRTQTVSALDLHALMTRLGELGREIDAVNAEIHEWRMRVLGNRLEHTQRQLAAANTPIMFKLTNSLFTSAKNLWRKFNP